MKYLLGFIFVTFLSINLHSQNCDYNYKSSIVMVEKKFEATTEKRTRAKNKIQSYKDCILTTKDSTELFWLNNAIAFHFTTYLSNYDSAGIFGRRAYEYNKERFCKDYVKLYVYHERDSSFPMQRPYMDVVNSTESKIITTYCLDNYKEAELQIYRDREKKIEETKSGPNFNQKYSDALAEIGINDQKERKQDNINWTGQNRLDSLNRIKLDELYSIYGFPTNDLVSKDGLNNAFIVLHHSKDCEWNEKWTRRFLLNNVQKFIGDIFAYYFYRNFNSEDGVCKDNSRFIEELRGEEEYKELLDFTRWKKLEKVNK